MSKPTVVNLSKLAGKIEIEPGYYVELPDSECLVVVAGANFPEAATRYDHPNVAARKDKVFHTRAYWPSGRKKWFSHAGRDFYFAIPRSNIALVFEKGYSYVPVVINGQAFRMNVTGGTFDGWTDVVRQQAHVGIGFTRKLLDLLAEVALPPEQAVGRVALEMVEPSEGDAASFVDLVAGHVCRSRLKQGDKLFLRKGWSYEGSRGPFFVVSKPKGRRCFVVWEGSEHRFGFRATYNAIDWTETAAANGITIDSPLLENRVGPLISQECAF